jgi:hypothetical protein
MRAGTFIAIVYILFLLTQPCRDVFAMPAERETGRVIQAATVDDCEDGGEICSPFCVCTCCSVPASFQHFSVSVAASQATVVSPLSNFDYTAPLTRSFAGSVWQPPKQ